MNNIICNYDLEFSHPRKQVLSKLQKSFISDDSISSDIPPSKPEKSNFFSMRVSVSCEESGNYLFTDKIQKMLDSNVLLDIGGSFIDNIGRGYVNSLGHKDYTKIY